MSELISQMGAQDLRVSNGNESPIMLREIASQNQAMLQAAISVGGVCQILSPGTYPVLSDTFILSEKAILRVGPAVFFSIDGVIKTLRSLSAIIHPVARFQKDPNQGVQTVLGVFGDSNSHNAIYTTGGVAGMKRWFYDDATDNYWQPWGWESWVGPISMQRVRIGKSWAASGTGVFATANYPQNLAYQISEALIDPAWSDIHAVVVMIGTNDYNNSILDWRQNLLTQLKRINKPVYLCSPYPRADAVNSATVANGLVGWAWFLNMREECRRIADNSGGWIRYVDTYSVLNSPSAGTDAFAAGYTFDNIHSNYLGAYKAADIIVKAVCPSGVSGTIDTWPSNSSAATSVGASSDFKLDQGHANPLMIATGGTVPAGSAYGSQTIVAYGSPTSVTGATGTANPLGQGNLQQITVASLADGDGFDATSASFHNAGGTFLGPGDSAWGQALVIVKSGGIWPKSILFRVIGYNGSNYTRSWGTFDPSKEVPLNFGQDTALLLRTPLITVPSGIAAFSSLTLRLGVKYAGAGSGVTQYNMECRRFRAGQSYF